MEKNGRFVDAYGVKVAEVNYVLGMTTKVQVHGQLKGMGMNWGSMIQGMEFSDQLKFSTQLQ